MNEERQPAVAGQFYEGNKSRLEQQIKNCFINERGPGTLPNIRNAQPTLKGIIVPHAGYLFSGPIAAHAYQQIAQHGFADTFILIGPNHTGTGAGLSLMTTGSWATPLGNIAINSDLAKKLHTGIIDINSESHQNEHSLEVQLPFLQYIAGSNRTFDIVPICMIIQDSDTSHEVGTILASAIKETSKKVVLIASTDFSHVGLNYMSMAPQNMNVNDYAHNQDNKAIKKILELNPKGLIDTVYKNKITMCGYGPVAAVLTASRILEGSKAELLKYGTSYEVHPGSSCVGYGSFKIY